VPSRPNKHSTKNQPEVQFHKAEGLIQRDDIETLRVVLEENPSLKNVRDLSGCTLVWIAAREGKLRCLSVLAGSLADVDVPTKTGATPLFVAALNGHSACIRLLAELKVNVNARLTETGATPMYAAAFEGKIDCITCLAELNADINAPNLEG
jgi:ankyrin repeat protein